MKNRFFVFYSIFIWMKRMLSFEKRSSFLLFHRCESKKMMGKSCSISMIKEYYSKPFVSIQFRFIILHFMQVHGKWRIRELYWIIITDKFLLKLLWLCHVWIIRKIQSSNIKYFSFRKKMEIDIFAFDPIQWNWIEKKERNWWIDSNNKCEHTLWTTIEM